MAVVQEGWFPWVVCFASFLYFTLQGGVVYSMGILYVIFNDVMDTSTSAVALIPSLQLAALYTIGPVAGLMVQRYGERPVALFGVALAASGLVCSFFATKVYHLYATFSLACGIGNGLVFVPGMTIIDKNFSKHKKLAAGFASCGVGVGSFIFPFLVSKLEEWYGWRGALLILGGLYFNGLPLCAFFKTPQVKLPMNGCEEKDSVADKVTNITNTDPHMNRTVLRSLALLLRLKFICLALHAVTLLFSFYAVYTHLGAYTLSLGYTESDVIGLYTVIGITATVSRACSGYLLQLMRVDIFVLASTLTILLGIISLVFPLIHSLYALYIYGALYTILTTPYIALMLIMVVECVPQYLVPTAFGTLIMLCTPGSALGAPLAAWLNEVTGFYGSAFYMTGGFFLISGIVLIPILPKWQRVEESGTMV